MRFVPLTIITSDIFSDFVLPFSETLGLLRLGSHSQENISIREHENFAELELCLLSGLFRLLGKIDPE